VQKDALNLSPEDAAALQLKDGEELCVESESGRMVRPVTIKTGMKPGILECVLFRERRDALSLSPGSSKTIAVSLRKAATRNGAQED